MTDLENIIDTVKDGVLLQTQTHDLIEYLRLTGGIANNFGGASKVIRVIITEVSHDPPDTLAASPLDWRSDKNQV